MGILNLGGDEQELDIGTYNQALTNSGYGDQQFQLQQPTMGQSAVPQATAAASQGGGVAGAPETPSVSNVQPTQSSGNQATSIIGGLLGAGGEDGNKLGAVLNIIGNVYGGGVQQATNAVGAARNSSQR
jgi:hypothetical protein